MKRLGIAVLLGTSLVAAGVTLADAPKPAAKPAPKPTTHTPDWYVNPATNKVTWVAPTKIPGGEQGELIRYGMELTKDTYRLLGPNSKKPYFTKRHNCTNCHLDMATSAWSSPWVVASLKFGGDGRFEPREGHRVTMASRIAECFQRTLGGTPLPPDSREEKALEAYMQWLSTGIKVKVKPAKRPKKGAPVEPRTGWEDVYGIGTLDVPLLDRAADPAHGKQVFMKMCSPCHGVDGAGTFDKEKDRIIFPPLWGEHAFGESAGMSMLPFAVKFIKANMPYGFANASDPSRQLSVEDAWDVAAFVVNQPRAPFPDKVKDWAGYGPDCMPNWLNKNPAAGFAPYYPRVKPDGTLSGDLKYPAKYPEKQYRYGPYKEIFADLAKLREEYKKHPNKGPDCKPWP